MSEGSGIPVQVSEHCANLTAEAGRADPGRAELATLAQSLETPAHERRDLLRTESAILVDGHLARLARRRGALDIAIGEGLRALSNGAGLMRFGYAGAFDYASERLGIKGSTAQKMVRFAERLRGRPLLRAAVWLGDITVSQAEAILPLAHGDAEEEWVARAPRMTVRALKAEVKAAGLESIEDVEEEWERFCVAISRETKEVFDEAMALAGKALRATTPKWERLEMVLQEYAGSHAAGDPREPVGILRGRVEHWKEELHESLEKETARWAFLDQIDPVAAPVPSVPVMEDPVLLDEKLRELASLRNGWDDSFGRFALLMRSFGFWRDVRFASFGQYCAERLGMSQRAVEQRIALERRLQAVPALRQALCEGRISYERARTIAWEADESTIGHWIDRACALTCVELRREVEGEEEAQMSARGQLELSVPVRVIELLADTFRAARAEASRHLTPDECLRTIAQHFVDTWGPALYRPSTLERKVLERDGGFCQVPRCSRAAGDAHHIRFRSQGGSDEAWNRVSVCPAHHLRGIHEGWIRARGTAPDDIRWEIDGEVLRKGPPRVAPPVRKAPARP